MENKPKARLDTYKLNEFQLSVLNNFLNECDKPYFLTTCWKCYTHNNAYLYIVLNCNKTVKLCNSCYNSLRTILGVDKKHD